MTYQEAYEKLSQIAQTQLLKYYDELSENGKNALLS